MSQLTSEQIEDLEVLRDGLKVADTIPLEGYGKVLTMSTQLREKIIEMLDDIVKQSKGGE